MRTDRRTTDCSWSWQHRSEARCWRRERYATCRSNFWLVNLPTCRILPLMSWGEREHSVSGTIYQFWLKFSLINNRMWRHQQDLTERVRHGIDVWRLVFICCLFENVTRSAGSNPSSMSASTTSRVCSTCNASAARRHSPSAILTTYECLSFKFYKSARGTSRVCIRGDVLFMNNCCQPSCSIANYKSYERDELFFLVTCLCTCVNNTVTFHTNNLSCTPPPPAPPCWNQQTTTFRVKLNQNVIQNIAYMYLILFHLIVHTLFQFLQSYLLFVSANVYV